MKTGKGLEGIIKKRTKLVLLALVSILLSIPPSVAREISLVEKFPSLRVMGLGPLPYNYRIIDRTLHAGGHPLNPWRNYGNSDEQTLKILEYLKSKGVKTVLNLDNNRRVLPRYRKLLKKVGIEELYVPMSSDTIPTEKEWTKIKEAFKEPIYAHCRWGADRTGAIIARYLVDLKGYSSREAWEAVISKGSHAGPLGGLKKHPSYQKLVLFFWKDSLKDPVIRRYY